MKLEELGSYSVYRLDNWRTVF